MDLLRVCVNQRQHWFPVRNHHIHNLKGGIEEKKQKAKALLVTKCYLYQSKHANCHFVNGSNKEALKGEEEHGLFLHMPSS